MTPAGPRATRGVLDLADPRRIRVRAGARDSLGSRGARGFTLIEIMVVVVILGVLATVVTVSVTDYLVKGKQNAAKSEIASIGSALQLFFTEQDRFPTTDEGLALLKQSSPAHPNGILQGDPPSPKGNYAPIETPNGVFCFARDQESSKAVWSAEEGYPGDFRYREFYRDIGFDLDMSYIGPYIHPMGLRINTGIKYFRITGKGGHKEPYVESWARDAARDHAANFLFNRDRQVEWLSPKMDTPPSIV